MNPHGMVGVLFYVLIRKENAQENNNQSLK